MHVVNVYDLGRVIDIEKYYPGNYGAPGMPRCKNRKRTPEDIERQNQTNKEKKLQRIILANFEEGWHLTLDYRPKDRPHFSESKKHIKKFLEKMRKEHKKAGLPFKYIVVTERGKKGLALHHHLIIEDLITNNLNTVQLVKRLWEYGGMNFKPLYEEGEYKKLAEYIVKKETKDEEEWATYSRSRNMIVPKPDRKIIYRKSWRKDPKPKKGYYIIADSVINGTNPVTKYPYQHYTMAKIRSKGGG